MKSVLLMAGLAASASTTLFTADLNALSLPISINYIKNGKFENNHLGNQDWFIS